MHMTSIPVILSIFHQVTGSPTSPTQPQLIGRCDRWHGEQTDHEDEEHGRDQGRCGPGADTQDEKHSHHQFRPRQRQGPQVHPPGGHHPKIDHIQGETACRMILLRAKPIKIIPTSRRQYIER